MFRPATALEGNLTDIWGSAYAASLDGTHTILGSEDVWPADVPPPTTVAQRARIVRFLADRSNGLFVAGQIRHLPAGQSWTQEWCVPHGHLPAGQGPPCAQGWLYSPPGVYQNGGEVNHCMHISVLALTHGLPFSLALLLFHVPVVKTLAVF
jgi:hypothetical protein